MSEAKSNYRPFGGLRFLLAVMEWCLHCRAHGGPSDPVCRHYAARAHTVPEWMRRVDRWLVDLFYPVHLNHYAVTIGVLSLAPQRSPMFFLLTLVLCIAVSWAVAQLTEPLSMRLRDRIRGVALR